MKRVAGIFAFAAALIMVTQGMAAARSAPVAVTRGHTGGMVRSHGHVKPQSRFRTNNLVYHTGGSVQTGTHHTYAVYWGPSTTFSDTKYQTLLNRYFTDVAAASGKTTNVYANDTQYYQTLSGATTHITYSESFAGSYWDTSTPSKGCSNTSGGTVSCVTDAQIQSEVNKVIGLKGWPKGLGTEYFVFLGNGISTCSGNSCFVSTFCAYHGDFTSGSSTVLYANMPYTGHNLSACGSGQYPNGDSAADSTINVTSHEANETITDPRLNAWYDRAGYEIGDKCAWNFGSSLGHTSYGNYNQVINTHDYYMQQEWSNAKSGCVLT